MRKIQNFLLFSLAFSLFFLLFSKVSFAWCSGYSDWQYRKPITITENSGSTLTDYQVKLTIDTASLISEGKMNEDCSDIRFAYENSSGEYEIPYWIESGCNSANTIVWIKVSEIPANGQTTIYMYYGNPSASSESNKTAVYDLSETFEEYSVDETNPDGWTPYGGENWLIGDDNGNHYIYNDGSSSYSNVMTAKKDTPIKIETGVYIYTEFSWTDGYGGNSGGGVQLTSQQEIDDGANRVSAKSMFGELGFAINLEGGYIRLWRENSESDSSGLGSNAEYCEFSANGYSYGTKYRFEIYYYHTNNTMIVKSLDTDNTYTCVFTDEPSPQLINDDLYPTVGCENSDPYKNYIFEIRHIVTPEPTYSIGSEEANVENLPPTIEISSPQNTTYYTTSLNLKFKVTDDNSTVFHVKAYFNNSLIYNNTNYQNNTEITIDLQPYLLDWMKTISVKVWANDTDQNDPQISEKTVYFSLDLYDFNFTLSNYTTFNNSKYAENLIYSYSARCGYLNHNATIKIYANNSEIYSREFVCDNSTITYQTTYKHSNEGLVNLTAKLLNYAGETKANQTYEYYNDLNPPIVDVSTTLHIGFYINYPQENGTYNVTDTISPYVLCSYYFGNANGTDNITRANYSKPYTYLYNLVHGNNTLKVNCSDILNHSTEHTLIQKVYLFHIKPIDEETGIYDEALWTDTATGNSSQFRFTSFDKNMNESFIFENISEDVYLVLTPTKSWILRFEQEYTDQIISDIYDLDYSPPTLYVCVAADKPTVFQTAYSSVPIEDKAFAVTRSDTGCVKTISETGLIENGYGFNFYTMSGHYALWYIENPFAWDQKTLLASFSGDAQITLDLEKALLLAQKIQEISIPSFNLLYISQYNGENATLIRYLSPETIKYFQINLTKEGEDEPFYTQTLSEATAIRILLYWNNFNLKSNDIIHIDYIAEFPDGRIDKGSLRTTPTGREIWLTWWEAAIIMFMPTVILFMRELDWKNIFVFSLIYVVCALIILPHSELNTVTQAFGLLGIVALFTAAIIIIKKV